MIRGMEADRDDDKQRGDSVSEVLVCPFAGALYSPT